MAETCTGKVVAGYCNIAADNKEISYLELDLLVGSELKWLPAGEAKTGWEMFDAKGEGDSKSVKVCRASFQYGIHIGRLKDAEGSTNDKVCSFGYAGEEKEPKL